MKAASRAGLTLVELMVSIVITGAATAIGYGAFSALIDHRSRIRTAMAETESAAALRETLHEWLTTGQIMVQNGGTPPLGGSETSDLLTFTTRALTPSQSPSTFVRLFIDDDPATPEHGLTMQYLVNQMDSMPRRELAPQVTTLRVEFLDERTRRWYAAREAATISPMAVRVTLEGTADIPLAPLLQLPLTIMMRDEPPRRPA